MMPSNSIEAVNDHNPMWLFQHSGFGGSWLLTK